jgi:AcrR family transcriptional regulator
MPTEPSHPPVTLRLHVGALRCAPHATVGESSLLAEQPDVKRPRELPLRGAPPERADARRNRLRILRAAGELVQQHGLDQLTIDDIAARAGVAKGTVFHRFGSRAGLATALLDDRERQLQDQLLTGPPPLGPGTTPARRLVAFLHALADFTDANVDLLIVSDHDTPGGRYETGAYGAWRLHTARLLEDLGLAARSEGLADALLAPLSADLIRHRRRRLGVSLSTIKAELDLLVDALATAANSASTR